MSGSGTLKRTIDFEVRILELEAQIARYELERKRIVQRLLNSGIIKDHHMEALEKNEPLVERPIAKTLVDVDLEDETLHPTWLEVKCSESFVIH